MFDRLCAASIGPRNLVPMKRLRIFASIVLLTASAAWSQPPGGSPMPFNISSTAFQPGGDIPRKYTCEGPDVSPALSWTDPPAGTQSFTLIGDDPDAPVGTWVHWVAYDVPASARQFAEGDAGTPPRPSRSDGQIQAVVQVRLRSANLNHHDGGARLPWCEAHLRERVFRKLCALPLK